MLKICSWVLSIILLLSTNVSAQGVMQDFLKRMKKANQSTSITYDYTVYLIDKKHNIADSITGKLFKQGKCYLDSNNNTIAGVNNDHYCKLDKVEKSATVIDIASFTSQFGVSAATSTMFDFSDSLLYRYGKLQTSHLPNGNYMYILKLKEQTASQITIEIGHEDLKIVSMEFLVEENDASDQPTGLVRKYKIHNLRYSLDDRILQFNRFFTSANDKITLSGKYSQYHLITLTN